MEPQFYDLNTGTQPSQMQPHKQQHQNKTEGTVGKIVMAVFASIFIGLSIIFFAMVVFPTLSDVAKLAVIYFGCIVFVATGTLLLVFLNPNNKAFLTISLCGTGLMYVAIFVSHFVFHLMPFWACFGITFLWSGFCAFFAKEISFVYQLIGQIMTFFLYLAYLPNASHKLSESLVAILAYFLSLVLFFVVNHKREYHKNWLNFSAAVFALIPLSGFADLSELMFAEQIAGCAILLLTLVMLVLSMTYYRVNEAYTVGFGIFSAIYMIGFMEGILWVIPNRPDWVEYIELLVMFTVAILGLVLLELKFPGKKLAGPMIWEIVSFIILGAAAVSFNDAIDLPIAVCIVAIAALLCGYLMHRASYKIAGLVYACLYLLEPTNDAPWLYFAMGMVLCIVAGILLFSMEDQYQTWCKVVYFFGIQWMIVVNLGTLLEYVKLNDQASDILILFLTVATTCLFAKLPILSKNLYTQEKEQAPFIAAGFYNIAIMLAVLAMLVDDYPWWAMIFLIVIGIACFSMNSWNLLKNQSGSWPAIYIGLKWLLFLLVCAGSIGAEGVVLSLITLFYSLLCIVLGFVMQFRLYKNYQNVRILGLVLVCLSLLKLLLIDIYYSSNLIRAVGFFIAGVLCFAISFVYHLIEKKMLDNK